MEEDFKSTEVDGSSAPLQPQEEESERKAKSVAGLEASLTESFSPGIDFDNFEEKQKEEIDTAQPLTEPKVSLEEEDLPNSSHPQEIPAPGEESRKVTEERDLISQVTNMRTPLKKKENGEGINSSTANKKQETLTGRKKVTIVKKNKENIKSTVPGKLEYEDYPLLVNVECCQNCKAHQYCTHHKEEKYQTCFDHFKQSVLLRLPEAQVVKNFGISNPLLGAFTVRVKGKVIFCKLQAKAWPNIPEVVERAIKALNEVETLKKDEDEIPNASPVDIELSNDLNTEVEEYSTDKLELVSPPVNDFEDSPPQSENIYNEEAALSPDLEPSQAEEQLLA